MPKTTGEDHVTDEELDTSAVGVAISALSSDVEDLHNVLDGLTAGLALVLHGEVESATGDDMSEPRDPAASTTRHRLNDVHGPGHRGHRPLPSAHRPLGGLTSASH